MCSYGDGAVNLKPRFPFKHHWLADPCPTLACHVCVSPTMCFVFVIDGLFLNVCTCRCVCTVVSLHNDILTSSKVQNLNSGHQVSVLHTSWWWITALQADMKKNKKTFCSVRIKPLFYKTPHLMDDRHDSWLYLQRTWQMGLELITYSKPYLQALM